LLEIVKQQKPRHLLEIGTAKGGTLFLLARVSPPDALLVSLDLPYGKYGGGYSPIRIPLYKRFARSNQRVALIRDDSHKQSSCDQVRSIIGEQFLDFLFIDGDHTYDGVKNDYLLYSPLVNKGGIIAFHDIARHGKNDACDVDKFWNEIKGMYKHEEIIEKTDQGWAGIGVLYV
jgi:predicted O-methyltransferase YrrM